MRTHFVTGGTGFIGRYLIEALLKQGDVVWLFARHTTLGTPAFISSISDYERLYPNQVRVCAGDLRKPDLDIAQEVVLELRSQPLVVWHLAANLSFSESDRDAVAETNIDGTRNVVDFANSLQGKFIFMSTAYVWGARRGVCRETEVFPKPNHRNVYESTKYESETIVLRALKLPYIILRPSIVIGNAYEGKAVGCTFGYYRYTYMYHFLKTVIVRGVVSKNLIGKLLRFLGTVYHQHTRLLHVPWLFLPAPDKSGVDLVPVDYVIESALRISENKSAVNKIFHLTNPRSPEYMFFLQALLEDLGLSGIKIVRMPGWVFAALFRTAAFFPSPLQKYLRSITWYLPYVCDGTYWSNGPNRRGFDRTNTEKYAGVPFPQLDRETMRKINGYAREMIYDRIKNV